MGSKNYHIANVQLGKATGDARIVVSVRNENNEVLFCVGQHQYGHLNVGQRVGWLGAFTHFILLKGQKKLMLTFGIPPDRLPIGIVENTLVPSIEKTMEGLTETVDMDDASIEQLEDMLKDTPGYPQKLEVTLKQ